jgi:glutamate synthase (NADPH/NADH) large chain
LVARHVEYTGSASGQRILDQWDAIRPMFVKVMPRDYKRVLMAEARARAESREPNFAELVGTTAS